MLALVRSVTRFDVVELPLKGSRFHAYWYIDDILSKMTSECEEQQGMSDRQLVVNAGKSHRSITRSDLQWFSDRTIHIHHIWHHSTFLIQISQRQTPMTRFRNWKWLLPCEFNWSASLSDDCEEGLLEWMKRLEYHGINRKSKADGFPQTRMSRSTLHTLNENRSRDAYQFATWRIASAVGYLFVYI